MLFNRLSIVSCRNESRNLSYFLVMMAIGGPLEAMKDNRALERRLTKEEET